MYFSTRSTVNILVFQYNVEPSYVIAWCLAATSPATRTAWEPTSVQDLHREYNNIFRHGNRNAASHLWSTFIFERSHGLSPSTLEMLFTGFCAVSGSPTRPSDYTRYRLTLPLVSGGITSGYMYYCCWPCVCTPVARTRARERPVAASTPRASQNTASIFCSGG